MRRAAYCLGWMVLAAACTKTAAVPETPALKPNSMFAAWSAGGAPEKRLCILPFENKTQSEGVADRLRESFFGRVALKRFADIEPRDLDARLRGVPAWQTLSPRKLGSALQCDALAYGEVTEASNLYLGVYAQLTLEARVQLIDAVSNETLAISAHATKFRAGGVPFSLFDIVPNLVFTYRHLSSEQTIRAVDDLARHLADKMPDLPPRPTPPGLAIPASVLSDSTAPQATVVAMAASTDGPVPALPLVSTPTAASEAAALSLPVPTSISTSTKQYRLQVGAFRKPAEARHAARSLHERGFRPILVTATQAGRERHGILLGPFPSLSVAQETREAIRKQFRLSPVVIRPITP